MPEPSSEGSLRFSCLISVMGSAAKGKGSHICETTTYIMAQLTYKRTKYKIVLMNGLMLSILKVLSGVAVLEGSTPRLSSIEGLLSAKWLPDSVGTPLGCC